MGPHFVAAKGLTSGGNMSDRDPGDYDATEVQQQPLDAWHPSHVPFSKSIPICAPTDTGRSALQSIRQNLPTASKPLKTAPKRVSNPRCWSDTPIPFKKLVARSAGLELTVCEKFDRDLSESEKAAIRQAASRLAKLADRMFAL